MELMLAPTLLLLLIGGRLYDDAFRNSGRYCHDEMLTRAMAGVGSMLAGLFTGAWALGAW